MSGPRRTRRFHVRRTRWPASTTEPLVSPLVPAVAHIAESATHLNRVYEGKLGGYTYSREGNPNADVVADRVAQLEGAEAGCVASSGMGIISAVLLSSLCHGDHWVASDQLYGRTIRLATQELPRLGVRCTTVPATEMGAYEAAIESNTRLVLVEVVSNPLVRVVDVAALAEICTARNVTLVVDNTFPTPVGFNPLAAGATLVLHSATKMLAGHSDCMAGIAVGPAPLIERLRDSIATWGMNPSPFDCWLVERGLETLRLRYEQAERNAKALATMLSTHPAVSRVWYPGLESHPDHRVACRLFGDRTGTMLSFELKGGRAAVDRFLQRAGQDLPFAPTLGDVCTLLTHPLSSSHRKLDPAEAERLGISEGLVRVSCGVEPTAELLDAFETALRGA